LNLTEKAQGPERGTDIGIKITVRGKEKESEKRKDIGRE
jgi:hypothetical protein